MCGSQKGGPQNQAARFIDHMDEENLNPVQQGLKEDIERLRAQDKKLSGP